MEVSTTHRCSKCGSDCTLVYDTDETLAFGQTYDDMHKPKGWFCSHCGSYEKIVKDEQSN